DAEDLEKVVVEAVSLALFVMGVLPVLAESLRAPRDLVPPQPHVPVIPAAVILGNPPLAAAAGAAYGRGARAGRPRSGGGARAGVVREVFSGCFGGAQRPIKRFIRMSPPVRAGAGAGDRTQAAFLSSSSSRSQISTSALVSASIIASVCAGPGVKRRRSVPRGTVGKLIGCT